MLKDKTLTYISLFSCAGVGCYGFKQEGFKCIATNEIVERRLAVQKYNEKCELESGYIAGDITLTETKEKIYEEIKKWHKRGNDRVDVLMATPPCQGISVINHKKNERDINRNSLVVESIEIVSKIQHRIFVFENVQAFEKTYCITPDDRVVRIGDYIREVLGKDYTITGRILNFMNYGSNSSRTRTLVIGIHNSYRNNIAPYDLFPEYRAEKTLREVIGSFPALEWGEICPTDFYHAFRTYDEKMRAWIHDLKEGESAFDNEDPKKRPHKVVDGEIVENVKKNRDKYTRQKWDRFVQCVHTRNDQLAAQNTLHPVEDRVFSIRELMTMMTVPESFHWVSQNLEELNALSEKEKRDVYKNNEVNIRQCLGEAVPTEIVRQIAANIKSELSKKKCETLDINKLIKEYDLLKKDSLKEFVRSNPLGLSIAGLQRIAELCNAKRTENAAFYTNKFMINEIMNELPAMSKDEIHILEPSVGVGGFLPFLFKKYADIRKVHLDLVDIDQDSIDLLRILLGHMVVPNNFEIHIWCEDFLKVEFPYDFDIAIGNPPYSKLRDHSKEMASWLVANLNKETNDLAEFFLEKCLRISDYTALVLNKTVLSSGDYRITRDLLRTKKIDKIIDFGRYGFSELSIETIALMVDSKGKPGTTFIHNLKYNMYLSQQQTYITDDTFPYYIIYRNEDYDRVAAKLQFDVFSVFRDRQITKKNTTSVYKEGYLRVLKARNITDEGDVENIDGYDMYINPVGNENLSAMKYVGDTSVYLTPNMTYNPRVMKNIPGVITDGSVAVLIPKVKMRLTEKQRAYFSSEEYRKFYLIARNLSTQSINIDKTSVFFYGVLKNDKKSDS